MVKALVERPSSWIGKGTVLAVAVLAMELGHASGVETRAWSGNAGVALVGSVLGLAMVAIVLARLFGRSIGLIHSDRAAIAALLTMITVKVVLARVVGL